MSKKFAVVIEKEKNGYHRALVVGLPGCRVRAKTFKSLTKNVRNEIRHYLRTERYIEKVDFAGVRIVESQNWTPKKFAVAIEKAGRSYIALVPSLPGCYTQAETIQKLIRYIKDAIGLYLGVTKDVKRVDFIGVQMVEV